MVFGSYLHTRTQMDLENFLNDKFLTQTLAKV
jgi:hypothetical protein